MKQANSFMVFVGWCVAICAVSYGLYWSFGMVKKSGYEAHEAKVANELAQAKADAEELTRAKGELAHAKAEIAALKSQVEAAKAEHAVLTPTFKALVDVKNDSDECAKKAGYNASEKCAYYFGWWTNHMVTISNSNIVIKKVGIIDPLAKYEFVRDAQGDIVDFKLVPPDQY